MKRLKVDVATREQHIQAIAKRLAEGVEPCPALGLATDVISLPKACSFLD
jgi:hypothetical protein